MFRSRSHADPHVLNCWHSYLRKPWTTPTFLASYSYSYTSKRAIVVIDHASGNVEVCKSSGFGVGTQKLHEITYPKIRSEHKVSRPRPTRELMLEHPKRPRTQPSLHVGGPPRPIFGECFCDSDPPTYESPESREGDYPFRMTGFFVLIKSASVCRRVLFGLLRQAVQVSAESTANLPF